MIEPQDAYTVLRRPLLPPKPERILPQPKLSMEDDAKLCNQRMWKEQGRMACGGSAAQAVNISRHKQAVAEREALAAKALTIITKRPRTAADLRELLHVTGNRMRAALGWLQSQGKADWTLRDGFAFWEVK